MGKHAAKSSSTTMYLSKCFDSQIPVFGKVTFSCLKISRNTLCLPPKLCNSRTKTCSDYMLLSYAMKCKEYGGDDDGALSIVDWLE